MDRAQLRQRVAESRTAERTPDRTGRRCKKLSRPAGAIVVGYPLGLGVLGFFRTTPVKSLPPERLAFTRLALRDGPLSSSAAAGNSRVLAGCVGLCHHGDGFCVCVSPPFLKPRCGRPRDQGRAQSPCHLVIRHCQLPLSSRTSSAQPPSPPAVVPVPYSRL